MTAEISWARPSTDAHRSVTASTAAELEEALDEAGAYARSAALSDLPHGVGVQVYDKATGGSLMFSVGLERTFLDWIDATTSARTSAYAPEVEPWHEDLAFDLYGSWQELPPEETRITAKIARAAALEYLRTGERPTNVTWQVGGAG